MRLAVIGTGDIHGLFCRACALVPDAQVYAVYSRSEERGRGFAALYQIPRVYTEYVQMLSDPLVDAVYVASPHYAHKAQVLAALEAGKDVLCEKSMALSLSDVHAMRGRARQRGRVLLEAVRGDFDPGLAALRAALPAIGAPRSAKLHFCKRSSRYDCFLRGDPANAFDPALGNSALADIGVYPLRLCISLFGLPAMFKARSSFLANGFEGSGYVLAMYEAFQVEILYSKTYTVGSPSVIVGAQGSLSLDSVSTPTRILFRGVGEQTDRVIYSFTPENSMVYELRAFMEMAAGNRSAEAYLDLTEQTHGFMDEIYREIGYDPKARLP